MPDKRFRALYPMNRVKSCLFKGDPDLGSLYSVKCLQNSWLRTNNQTGPQFLSIYSNLKIQSQMQLTKLWNSYNSLRRRYYLPNNYNYYYSLMDTTKSNRQKTSTSWAAWTDGIQKSSSHAERNTCMENTSFGFRLQN